MSADNKFGLYLRELREKQKPKVTQEQLADFVKKKKMTISQIESGKNAPPQGEFLQKIVECLSLTESEKIHLYDLAAIARGAVPTDIAVYFNEHAELRNAIRRAKSKNLTDADWQKMI